MFVLSLCGLIHSFIYRLWWGREKTLLTNALSDIHDAVLASFLDVTDLHVEALRVAQLANATVAYKDALVPVLMLLEFVFVALVVLLRIVWTTLGVVVVGWRFMCCGNRNTLVKTITLLNCTSETVSRKFMSCVHWCVP